MGRHSNTAARFLRSDLTTKFLFGVWCVRVAQVPNASAQSRHPGACASWREIMRARMPQKTAAFQCMHACPGFVEF